MSHDVSKTTKIDHLKAQKIAVLGGGFSRERDVSLRSAQRVLAALTALGYTAELRDPADVQFTLADLPVVFNMLHGRYGEDGTIQSYMDSLPLAYTGSSIAASQLSMNKVMTKWLLRDLGLPTASFCVGVTASVPEHSLSFPVIIKPIDEGSSVGVEIVDTAEQLVDRVRHHHAMYGAYMLESFVEGQEVTVGILENESEPVSLPILELRPHNRFYDYEAKYTPGKTDFILPAELSDAVSEQCRSLGYKFFKALGCSGFGRVDMIVSKTEGPFILEANTLPGMTETSDLPAQVEHEGLSYESLVESILLSAYPRLMALKQQVDRAE